MSFLRNFFKPVVVVKLDDLIEHGRVICETQIMLNKLNERVQEGDTEIQMTYDEGERLFTLLGKPGEFLHTRHGLMKIVMRDQK